MLDYSQDIEEQIKNNRGQDDKPRDPIPEGPMEVRVLKVSNELSRSKKLPMWVLGIGLISKDPDDFWHGWDRSLYFSESVGFIMEKFMDMVKLKGAKLEKLGVLRQRFLEKAGVDDVAKLSGDQAKDLRKKSKNLMIKLVEDAMFGQILPVDCVHDADDKGKIRYNFDIDWEKVLDEDGTDEVAEDELPDRSEPPKPEKEPEPEKEEPKKEEPKAEKTEPAGEDDLYGDLV